MENNNKPRGFFRRQSDADSQSRNEHHGRNDESQELDRPSRDDYSRPERPPFSERRPSGDRPSGDRPSGDRPWQKREGVSNDRLWHKREGGNSDRPGNRSEGNDRPRYGSERNNRPDRFSRGPERGTEHGDRRESPQERPEREAPENVIFGIHPVREAIEAGTQIEKIYFRREGYAHVDEDARRRERWDRGDRRRETPRDNSPINTAALDALRLEAADAGIHIQEVPVEKLNRLTRNGNHQGVVAVTAAIEYKEINELIENIEKGIEAYNRSQELLASQEAVSDDQVIVEEIAQSAATAPLIVVMDSVTDIRNFGAIARSAECAGAMALVMPLKNSAPVNAEAIKSSAGALNLIPVSRVGSLKGAVARLKDAGLQIVAATEKSDTLLYEVDLTRPTAIVMGAEDRGISRDILAMCDAEVCIPLAGRIESLNVSAAAAVMLFEATRQRFEKR